MIKKCSDDDRGGDDSITIMGTIARAVTMTVSILIMMVTTVTMTMARAVTITIWTAMAI